MAKGRLRYAIQKLNEKNLVSEYNEILVDQVKRGFIEKVVEEKSPIGRCHYIPHFPVIREHHTTPIRIVMDASAKCPDTGYSLNDMLHTGPSLVPELTQILLRFRIHKYVCISDISKAFLCVGLNKEDRDFTRFLWPKNPLDNKSPLDIYRFKRVLFGATSSPFLLQATIRFHFDKYISKHGVNSDTLTRNLYVDNLSLGSHSEKDLLSFYHESVEGYLEAGLPLREWMSNAQDLNEQAVKDGLADTTECKTVKMLGLKWDSVADEFFLNKVKLNSNANTKREILAESCKIFDPLGFFFPVTIRSRMLIQKMWKEKMDWDEKISEELCKEWRGYVSDAEELFSCRVPRWVIRGDMPVSLHLFADASTEAMGCCAYIVQGNSSTLLMSKARVAPVKSLTVPKLELTAALLASRVAKYIIDAFSQEIHFEEVHLFCDSQITLCWIINGTDHKNIYVRNRVSEFRENVPKMILHYIDTDSNPSDLLTRNKSLYLCEKELWWKGPKILSEPECWKPYCPSKNSNINLVAVATVKEKPTVIKNDGIPDIARYSNLDKLYRVTCYVLRCRILKKSDRLQEISIIPEEMNQAELVWLKEHQRMCFPDVLAYVQGTSKVKPPIMNQLWLTFDRDLIKVNSRLKYAELPESTINPILLSDAHDLSKLLIKDAHERTFHGSVTVVMAYLRARFWVPRIRQVVKGVLHQCTFCRLLKGTPYLTPETPALPSHRVSEAAPFQFCGVDYTGPLYVKEPNSKSTVKCYIALFTCFNTRAVHLEVASDASSEAFARVFRRFVGHQTAPQVIYSDRGSNFVGFQSILKEILNTSCIKEEFLKHRTSWKFIPAKAPWFGGVWERLVGVTKRVLKRVLGNSFVTFDEMNTIVVEVCSRINKRPITYMGSTVNELVPLTPIQLLKGVLPDSLPIKYDETELEDATFELTQSALSRRFKRVCCLVGAAWTRWKEEYLLSLRERDRKAVPGISNGTVQPQLGDIVLFQSDVGQKCLDLGRVIKLVVGKDGQIRVVHIRTNKGETIRPVARVSFLEAAPFESKPLLVGSDPDLGSGGSIGTIARPTRKAAIAANNAIKSDIAANLI